MSVSYLFQSKEQVNLLCSLCIMYVYSSRAKHLHKTIIFSLRKGTITAVVFLEVYIQSGGFWVTKLAGGLLGFIVFLRQGISM